MDDKILITSTSMISGNDYVALIEPILSGKTVGHNVGDICYNKEIPLVNSDDKFQIIDQRGKITVINFWFTSCTPCVKELPHFDKIYKELTNKDFIKKVLELIGKNEYELLIKMINNNGL